jgi:cyclopropane fatty-acyl-phospholipid synthase-like methyltransferase
LIRVNPLKVLLWTFRRNPADVIDLYNTFSPVMQLATGGDMLNFGYWNGSSDPISAQQRLCSAVGDIAELSSAKRLIDIGSGLGAPARFWVSRYGLRSVVCVNINRRQLVAANGKNGSEEISCVNATSVILPFPDGSADRIIALESAQHFRPLPDFVKECKRVLAPGGALLLAIPVTAQPISGIAKLLRLGILSFTWSSEHYSADYVTSALSANGFKIASVQSIAHEVYEPLTNFYIKNRTEMSERILREYPAFVEKILHRSLLRMKKASQDGLIDYLLIRAE